MPTRAIRQPMSHQQAPSGTGQENVLTPAQKLVEAARSLEAARELLEFNLSLGRDIRDALRSLLEAQESLEREGPDQEVRLKLLAAVRRAAAAEQQLKEWVGDAGGPEEVQQIQDRRAWPRYPVSYRLKIDPKLRSAERSVSPFPVSGVTINLSRGGMLARLDRGIPPSSRCLIHLLNTGGNVRPDLAWGRIHRSHDGEEGWEVGIEFEEPLELLRPDRLGNGSWG